MDDITYIPNWLLTQAEEAFEVLYNELDWERRTDAPRYEYWTNIYGQPYTYGRGAGQRTYLSKPDHTIIEAIRFVLYVEFGADLEGCFLNRYDDNRDHLGWHSDDDPAIDHTKPIAVITLGAAREIQWREIEIQSSESTQGRPDPQKLLLEPGSLFVMKPGFQQKYQHRIPKAGYKVDPRISLTFRGLIHNQEG